MHAPTLEHARKRQQNSRVVSEIIGRSVNVYPQSWALYNYTVTSVDRTQPDYRWWSLFRRGKQAGYELGGLFARPILDIMGGWVLGSGFTLKTGDRDTDSLLAKFVTDTLGQLLTWYKDGLGLGDSYVVMNPDGTLTLVPASCVEVVTDDLDYRTVTAIKIITRLEKATITDEYTATTRTITVKSNGQPLRIPNDEGGFTEQKEVSRSFANPLGVIPIVHYAHGQEANEVFGHPVYEALLKLFARYDRLLNKSLDGAEVMGRPVPVAYVEDPELAKEQNKTRDETVDDIEGNSHNVPVIDFEELEMFWLKATPGVKFEFAAPGSFSADSVAFMKKLFYLMLEHTMIPEWAWGGAVASSKASVDGQMPAFIRAVGFWRTELEPFILQLVALYLATISFFKPLKIPESIAVQWPEVTGKDEALLLNKVRYAHTESSLVSDETALSLLDMVPPEDVEAEVSKAKEQAQERQDQFDATVEAKMNDMKNQPPNKDEEDDGA
jgi:hypothetical protein